jgi:hypothetical protein
LIRAFSIVSTSGSKTTKQRQQAFGEPGQIPQRDAWLVGVGVAAHFVDRGEYLRGVIFVHEGAGAVIDGLARDRHVVGVHDAMNETDHQPFGDEISLPAYHKLQQSEVAVHGASRFRVMARDNVVGEMAERIRVCTDGEGLEGADADMAGCDAREDGAGQRHFTANGLAGRDGCQRPGGGNAKCGHRFADDVLPQYRPKRCAAVAIAREGGGARAFQLNVPAHAICIDDLAQKNGPAITKLRHEGSELVAGIGHGERLARVRHAVAREHCDAFCRHEHFGIKPKVPGECFIQPDEARCGDGRGLQARKQALR